MLSDSDKRNLLQLGAVLAVFGCILLLVAAAGLVAWAFGSGDEYTLRGVGVCVALAALLIVAALRVVKGAS